MSTLIELEPASAEQLESLPAKISQTGFCFAPGELVQTWLEALSPGALREWPEFAASWNDMPLDQFMADGGRYRRRRYATLNALSGSDEIHLEPHQPHYQTVEYNPLNGGVMRHFEPVREEIVLGNTVTGFLRFGVKVYGQLIPDAVWHIELHQFRIEAGLDQPGKPTPEGVHRDGTDFVLVMMVKRENVASGLTTMHDLELNTLDSFTLTHPCDVAMVNDRRYMHGVTPVEQIDPARPAYRDVLVATFRNTKR
jgi:hypothetical protein